MKNEYEMLNDVEIDFSKYENINISNMERDSMKKLVKTEHKSKRAKVMPIATAAAALVGVLLVSQTAFAKDTLETVKKNINLGHNNVIEVEDNSDVKPDDVAIVDKSTDIEDPLEAAKNQGNNIIMDENNINDNLCFECALPTNLPEGYVFYGAYTIAGSDEYIFVYYKNETTGNYIMIDERIINEETAYVSVTNGEVVETTVNNNVASIQNDNSIMWENNDIAYGITAMNGVTPDQLVEIAESIQ